MTTIFYKSLILIVLILFTASCSESQTGALIESYSSDFNSSVLPTEKSIKVTVYENYSDGESVEVSDSLVWSTSDDSLATVEDGLVTTYAKEGLVEISYETTTQLNNGSPLLRQVLKINVEDLTLEEINLSVTSLEVYTNSTSSAAAFGVYENDLTFDITNDVVWLSTNEEICSVDTGVISCLEEGNVTITCSDDNVTSDELLINVSLPLYSKIEISSDKTTFNAEQTIQLEVIGTTSDGESITIDNSELVWNNLDSSIVDFDTSTAIATATQNGEANISVELNSDSGYEDSILLSVDKEEYMRLFRGDTEIEFPFADINESESLDAGDVEEFETFYMIAVGRDFVVSELSVTNFSGVYTGTAWFYNLLNYETIAQDENRSFELQYSGEQTELHYYFKINDDYANDFSMKYSVEDD